MAVERIVIYDRWEVMCHLCVLLSVGLFKIQMNTNCLFLGLLKKQVGKVSTNFAAAKKGKVGSNFSAVKNGQVSSSSKKR